MMMGRAVSLHPLAILVAVTCGTLLLGIIGAVLAVPLVAATYQAIAYLGWHRLLDAHRCSRLQPVPQPSRDHARGRPVTAARPLRLIVRDPQGGYLR